MKKHKLPKTDSIRELAKFWDTHDLTDFEDQLEEVTEPIFDGGASISVILPAGEAEALQRLAQAKGISEQELVRLWILQKLAGSESPKSAGTSKGRRQSQRAKK